MSHPLAAQIEAIIGRAPQRIEPLHGGSIAQVYRAYLPGDTSIVAKTAPDGDAKLGIEGYMLRYLAGHSRLPVPRVVHESDTLLLMEYIEGSSQLDDAAQRHAADLLAALHTIRAPQFGLERDTLIGGLHQPNPPTDSWLAFFRDQRLLYMGGEAARSGRLPSALLSRLERFAAQLDRWLSQPEHPSLIHGDMWTTNILARNGVIAGFIDPAIYYAHPEIELAFSTLFGTFDRAFFHRYDEHRPIAPGFFEERRDIYNLYPLLVHVRLFGGGYVGAVDQILRRFGF
jgi:fructosamine-3-kinase